MRQGGGGAEYVWVTEEECKGRRDFIFFYLSNFTFCDFSVERNCHINLGVPVQTTIFPATILQFLTVATMGLLNEVIKMADP
jgi:hypothetical protein